MVPPGFSRPRCSASSMIFTAMRSFEEPPGFRYSTFARIVASTPAVTRLRRTSGVSPMVSRIVRAYFMTLPSIGSPSPRRSGVRTGGTWCRRLAAATATRRDTHPGSLVGARRRRERWNLVPRSRRLLSGEPGVEAAAAEELLGGAALHDAAPLHHVDDVGLGDGREPVGDRDRRAPPGCGVEGGLHRPLGDGVEGAR